MSITKWYRHNLENRLQGRYITLDMIKPILSDYEGKVEMTIAGYSEMGREIPLIQIGAGSKKILAWSQMHGNESTTTKALFDFIKFLSQENYFQSDIDIFLAEYTLYILPILNPDGAALFTRFNVNEVDLNRDAQSLSQEESKVLRFVFEKVSPNLCLNMHDQRTIFGLESGKPATVSFLSPAANAERTMTPARQMAMGKIVKMYGFLQTIIPGQVGRYDDSYNAACVGDAFQKEGVPTILFEAGHFPGDYQREESRAMIFYALLALFDFVKTTGEFEFSEEQTYLNIPKNKKNFRDILVRNVVIEQQKKAVDLAIQYVEELNDGHIDFEPQIDAIGDLSELIGHREIDVKFDKISKKAKEMLKKGGVIHKIHNKNDVLMINFDLNVF